MDILLQGTIDESNPLSNLNNLVLNHISDIIDDDYDKHIDQKSVASKTDINLILINITINRLLNTSFLNEDLYKKWKFQFPEYTGINVNMMPFNIFRSKDTLPEYLHQYLPLINSCPIYPHTYKPNGEYESYNPDKICYLTIHESIVKKGETQRRGGLHIERPGSITTKSRFVKTEKWGDNEYSRLSWGMGTCTKDGFPIDGIYMATNTPKSCKIYDVLIDKPEEITDKHGGIDHIMKTKLDKLRKSYYMEPNKLYWMTDRTPHESMPVEEDCKRQYFRLIVGKISVWYSQHNTANPLYEPDAPIVNESKFV